MIRLLILCDKRHHDTKMSRIRFHLWEAISKHPEIKAVFDGPGFDGWAGVKESIQRNGPDYIFWYKPKDMPDWREASGVPTVLSFNEMWNKETFGKEIEETNAAIVIAHHENDLPAYAEESKRRKFVNIKHCIDPSRVYDMGRKRDIDILFSGNMSPTVYPFRSRLRKMADRGMFRGRVVTIHHPSYRIGNVDEQYRDFVENWLNRAKIVIACGSVHKYRLVKYLEGVAAGALVAGDLPDDDRPAMSEAMAVLKPGDTDEMLARKINAWLENDVGRAEVVRRGKEYVRNYTVGNYANRFVQVLKEYQNGKAS